MYVPAPLNCAHVTGVTPNVPPALIVQTHPVSACVDPCSIKVNADRNSSAADPEESYVDLESLERNGVVLVYNNGTWLDEIAADSDNLSSRTRNDVFNLFNTFIDSSTAVTLSTVPTLPSHYVVVTYDPINDADVWLISNLTNLPTIELSEIQLIGQINGHAGIDLWTSLITSGSILG